MRDIVLTGIPRSGTTLLTALMDSQPASVALNEPQWQYDAMAAMKDRTPAAGFARWLIGDFADIRRKLLQGIAIPERRRNGTAPTNYYRSHAGDRRPDIHYELVPFTRPGLTGDFTLAVKHNGLYLGVLPELAATGHFTIAAIVRHPAGAIASWRDTKVPPGKGLLPGAAGYWKEMRELTAAPMDLLEKQVRMYDLICQRLLSLKDNILLLRYEDITGPGGEKALAPLGIASVDPAMITPRKLDFYDPALIARIQEAYAKFARAAKALYPA
ncbi:MAG: sulfotransferase domain-containing protein [Pseudomonadota bacterium]|nr:sulfotransferase domain-containing protein [Pseudomonadota bacterium]